MKTSSNFINNNYIEQNNAVILEVGIDDENDIQHRLNLIISFGSPSGYNELSFYFNLTDKDNTKITSNPKSIYDREIAKKYLPKDLDGRNVFIEKLKEMLKQLLKMETPQTFFMETFEDHSNRKQLDYYYNLVRVIMDNGYMLAKEGVNPLTKKYFWKFVNENTLSPLTEEMQRQEDNFNNRTGIKDEEYWKRHDERAEEIIKGIRK